MYSTEVMDSSHTFGMTGGRKRGFSLVELSIVLVILGLLVGGILTGQNLIRAAELRSITSEVDKYKTAFYVFRDKYFYLPGDMPNAFSFWGAAAGCTNTTVTDAINGGCNGNGDGTIGSLTAGGRQAEAFRAWQQLDLAGMIEGSYTGVTGPGNPNDVLLAVNSPESKISAAGYHIESFPDFAGDTARFPADYGSVLKFGIDNGGGQTDKMVLTPAETWGIDQKIDDGLPGKGRVMTYKGTHSLASNCNDSDDPDISKYSLNNDAIACNMIFLTQ